jgi:hypothetical protein
MTEYAHCYNTAQPHQALGQQHAIPRGSIHALPVLGGLQRGGSWHITVASVFRGVSPPRFGIGTDSRLDDVGFRCARVKASSTRALCGPSGAWLRDAMTEGARLRRLATTMPVSELPETLPQDKLPPTTEPLDPATCASPTGR